MKEFWENRYAAEQYAYGEVPNVYFKSQLSKLQPGKILLPAEGEGRNAVYAAKLGWEVVAFDPSREGKAKADKLAAKNQVRINYLVGSFEDMEFAEEQFDAIGLIYAHFPAHLKSSYHKTLNTYLRKGGTLIFEAFSKSHLQFNSVNQNAGGPKDIDMLFSVEELQNDFSNYSVEELAEQVIELQEGLYHNGKSVVIRFVGKKK